MGGWQVVEVGWVGNALHCSLGGQASRIVASCGSGLGGGAQFHGLGGKAGGRVASPGEGWAGGALQGREAMGGSPVE